MLQITPNPRQTGNLNITANSRARMASVLSIDWDHVTGVPNGITAIGSATGVGLLAIIDADGHGATRTITPPAAGITVSNGDGAAGNPTLALANDLAALEGLDSTGFAARTATDTWAQRTLTAPAAGFTITNPAGVAGNPIFVLANDLAAVEGLASTGIAVRSATDTWVQRTITGTAAEITLTNGDGVSGNPTASLPSALTFTGKTITGGTYASAVTFNKVTITAPASAATLTLIDGTTLTGPASSGTVMTLGNTETVTGIKTFGSAGAVGRFKLAGTTSGTTVLDASATASGTLTLPAATDTLVGKATTDILTNKTYDTAGAGNSFSINSLAATANTGTGSVVRATSPTLVTPALGTPTALVLTSATGLPLAGLAAQAAFTFVGNNTSGSAVPTAVDIHTLTLKASPAATDEVIISDQAASGAWKRSPVSSLASASGVSSIDTATGAFTISGLLSRSTQDLRVTAAVQADQETGTSNTVSVTPGTQKFHPSAAKAWVYFDGLTGGVATIKSSFGVTSVTRNSAGTYTVTFSTAFSSATAYAFQCMGSIAGTGVTDIYVAATSDITTTTFKFATLNPAGTFTDATIVSCVFFGDQ